MPPQLPSVGSVASSPNTHRLMLFLMLHMRCKNPREPSVTGHSSSPWTDPESSWCTATKRGEGKSIFTWGTLSACPGLTSLNTIKHPLFHKNRTKKMLHKCLQKPCWHTGQGKALRACFGGCTGEMLYCQHVLYNTLWSYGIRMRVQWDRNMIITSLVHPKTFDETFLYSKSVPRFLEPCN